MVQSDGLTDDDIIRRMRIACWITEATDIHSEYVILAAFRRQQWLRERNPLLRYTHIACLVRILLPNGLLVCSHHVSLHS
jgi:hypothetical protein